MAENRNEVCGHTQDLPSVWPSMYIIKSASSSSKRNLNSCKQQDEVKILSCNLHIEDIEAFIMNMSSSMKPPEMS